VRQKRGTWTFVKCFLILKKDFPDLCRARRRNFPQEKQARISWKCRWNFLVVYRDPATTWLTAPQTGHDLSIAYEEVGAIAPMKVYKITIVSAIGDKVVTCYWRNARTLARRSRDIFQQEPRVPRERNDFRIGRYFSHTYLAKYTRSRSLARLNRRCDIRCIELQASCDTDGLLDASESRLQNPLGHSRIMLRVRFETSFPNRGS